MENVVLIGMPGVGKSTIGVILAKELQYRFIDSDLVIQEREGRRLREIIAREGLSRFLEIENEANLSIRETRAVIATGGSAVYGEEAMERFRREDLVLYLRLPFEAVARRVGDPKRRGVAMREGQTLRDVYEERRPLYEKYAHVTVDVDGLTLGEAMRKIKNSSKIGKSVL